MKQRHSYHRLLFHVVFHTKYREPVFQTAQDEREIGNYLKLKANELDCYIEELGGWLEHLHLLLRTGTTIALCKLYRQLKGFSSHSWNLRHADRRLRWGDGVFISTVDPENCTDLKRYIRYQRIRHRADELVGAWEPDAK